MTAVQAARAEAEHLFRRDAGRIIAALTRVLGAERLDLAHDAAQDAFVRALQTWPHRGVPENPSAWLIQAARNRAIDVIRRERRTAEFGGEVAATFTATESGFDDDPLTLMFLCCHPELAPEVRVALTLRSVCGFGTREIARAFLLEEATIAQRLVRAKRAIRARRLRFEMPGKGEMRSRLDSVLAAIYLVFNEGYSATQGEQLIREEICHEAIWLATLLAEHPATASSAVYALRALLRLQAARLGARVNSAGELALLEEQDRDKWDQTLLRLGFEDLDRAASGDQMTPYHVEAAIAAAHALPEPDWPNVVELYDTLLALQPTPVVELNRAVAVSRCFGPRAGLELVEALRWSAGTCTMRSRRDFGGMPASAIVRRRHTAPRWPVPAAIRSGGSCIGNWKKC
jgi:RNA polymerase sigma-70 factor (ECF subfamily)